LYFRSLLVLALVLILVLVLVIIMLIPSSSLIIVDPLGLCAFSVV
jgi:hypothetical protein